MSVLICGDFGRMPTVRTSILKSQTCVGPTTESALASEIYVLQIACKNLEPLCACFPEQVSTDKHSGRAHVALLVYIPAMPYNYKFAYVPFRVYVPYGHLDLLGLCKRCGPGTSATTSSSTWQLGKGGALAMRSNSSRDKQETGS